MRKEKNLIEIQEDVKVGNVILEKGDKIKVLESSSDRRNLYNNSGNDEVHTRFNMSDIDMTYDEIMDTAEDQYELSTAINIKGSIDFMGSVYDMEDFFNSVLEADYEDYLI